MTEQTVTIATAVRAVTLCCINLRNAPWSSHNRGDFHPVLQRALAPVHIAAGLFPNRYWPAASCNLHEQLVILGNQIISASSAIRDRPRRPALRELRKLVRHAETLSDRLAKVKHYEPGEIPDNFETLQQLQPGVYEEPAYRRAEGAQPDDLSEISHVPDLSVYNKQIPTVDRSINTRGYALLRLPVLAWFRGVDNAVLRETLEAAGVQLRHYYANGWLLLDQLMVFYHPDAEDSERQAADRRRNVLGRVQRRLSRRGVSSVDVMDGADNFSRTAHLHYCWLFDAAVWARLKRRASTLLVEQVVLVPDSQESSRRVQLPLRELRLQMEAQIAERTASLRTRQRELRAQINALNDSNGRVLSATQRDLLAEVDLYRQRVIALRQEVISLRQAKTAEGLQRRLQLCGPVAASDDLSPGGGDLGAAVTSLRDSEYAASELQRNIDNLSALRGEDAALTGQIEQITTDTTNEWRARYLPKNGAVK